MIQEFGEICIKFESIIFPDRNYFRKWEAVHRTAKSIKVFFQASLLEV